MATVTVRLLDTLDAENIGALISDLIRYGPGRRQRRNRHAHAHAYPDRNEYAYARSDDNPDCPHAHSQRRRSNGSVAQAKPRISQ